jgi:small subunit ribosomal protein S1
MANEVNNQTEESVKNETPVSEQANTNDSVTATDEQTTVGEESSTVEQTTVDEEPAATEQTASHEEDFGSILEKFEQEQTIFHNGDLVEGKVVGISERGVLIDFGYKSEGIAPIEDFTSPTGEVTVEKGDAVEAIIKSITSGDAPPMLSRADAVSRKSWTIIEKAFNDETPIVGHVLEVTKGGLRVDLDGVEAFLPGSLVDSRPIRNLNSFVGQDIEAKIIKFSRKRNNIVLSRKALTDEVVNKQKSETLGNLEEGFVIEGTVKNLTEYGAFVDIGGIDGLLHVTDMSWGRLQNPGDQFKVNDQIQVKVLKLDREKEKVALGYKQLIPDPWSTVMEIYPINAKIKGRVSSVTEYGAFIELEPGVEGLVHVSEMSWSKRSQSPKKLVRPGDEVEVQVLGVDTDDRRISLGMKQLQPNPWQTVHERYRVGQTVRGKVRNLTDFGAFIEIEDGIDGLVHISDITHSKKLKHAKDVLKRDQEVEAVIKNIDTDNRRMALSIKELTPSAWDDFVTSHKPGDVVRGKISRFTGFGVFVELGNELEGLCHISELSDERVERPEDIGSIGQEMDFKILRIEHDVQKIGLSARAVGKEDEPVVDTKSYSTEAKGGMASLGELMNLKRGGEEVENKPDEPRLSKKERKALQAKERAEQEELAAAQPVQEATTEADETASVDSESSEAVQAETETENQPALETTETDAPAETETAESSESSEAATEPEASTPEITAETEAEPTVAETVAEAEETESSVSKTTAEAETEPSVQETAAETNAEPSVSETVDSVEATPAVEETKSEDVEETPLAEETKSEAEEEVAATPVEQPAASKPSYDDEDLLDLGDMPEKSDNTSSANADSVELETEISADNEEKKANG